MEQSGMHDGNPAEQREGQAARSIEEQTAKVPSDIFLWAAGAAIVGSLIFQIAGTRRGMFDIFHRSRAPFATFLGMWAPTLVALGTYSKIAKVAGSDSARR
jgi:hypothetical protein